MAVIWGMEMILLLDYKNMSKSFYLNRFLGLGGEKDFKTFEQCWSTPTTYSIALE